MEMREQQLTFTRALDCTLIRALLRCREQVHGRLIRSSASCRDEAAPGVGGCRSLWQSRDGAVVQRPNVSSPFLRTLLFKSLG